MGWLISSEIINADIKKTLPGLENFYMAASGQPRAEESYQAYTPAATWYRYSATGMRSHFRLSCQETERKNQQNTQEINPAKI